jgi:CheY-like chemotaxis protein
MIQRRRTTKQRFQVRSTEIEEVVKKNRILIVDDNDFNAITLQAVLKQEYKLDSDIASNGLEAIKTVEGRIDDPYRLILMDCMMPVMDGFDGTKRIV